MAQSSTTDPLSESNHQTEQISKQQHAYNRKFRMNQPRATQISKAMSLLLRHKAAKEGLKLDERGFAGVGNLLNTSRLRSLGPPQPTFSELRDVVKNDAKGRFELLPLDPSSISEFTALNPKAFKIRATQGHSIPLSADALGLERLTLRNDNVIIALPATEDPSDADSVEPSKASEGEHIDKTVQLQASKMDERLESTVVHGTFYNAWNLILRSGGLKQMGRGFVHFATPDIATVVGGAGSSSPSASASSPTSLDPSAAEETGLVGPPQPESSKAQETAQVKSDSPQPKKSGIRAQTSIHIHVSVSRSLAAGALKWYRSSNGVYLCPGDADETKQGEQSKKEEEESLVGVEWWDKVTERKKGKGKKVKFETVWKRDESKNWGKEDREAIVQDIQKSVGKRF